MHEHDRIGVNLVVTGLSAAAGFKVGGPDGVNRTGMSGDLAV